MKRLAHRAPPTGLARWLFRLPIHLYRWRLGRVFGHRLLLLTHTGRSSGLRRDVVLEVVDRDTVSGSYLVCSGFGPKAAWYRNVLAHPEVTIQVAGRTFGATARKMTIDEGAAAMADYAARHPRAARRLARLMGFQVDGSAGDFRELGRNVPFVEFLPGR